MLLCRSCAIRLSPRLFRRNLFFSCQLRETHLRLSLKKTRIQKNMVSEVSVVICAYTEKRWDELLAAIDSVQRQTVPPKDVIVVIDHNSDLLQRVRDKITDVL